MKATRSSINKPRNIHEIIRIYSADVSLATPDVMKKLDDAIAELKQPRRFTLAALKTPGGADLLEALFADIVRGWPSREKNKVAQALLKFASYLRTTYGIILNESLLPKDIPNATDRRLDILKFLQTPRTMEDLEARYATSDRTLRNDLNALVDGWELLGNQIKIRRVDKDGKISYNSTIHPVLLPLNLTEVYSLVAGFPKLAEGTVYEEIAAYLAQAVASQLSDYALNIISQSLPEMRFKMWSKEEKSYRQEEAMLKKSQISWLIYMMKQGRKCRVTYMGENGEVLRLEEIPSLNHEDLSCVAFQDSSVMIPISDILFIEPVDPYR